MAPVSPFGPCGPVTPALSLRPRRSLRSGGSGIAFVPLRPHRAGRPLNTRRPLVSLGYEHRPVLSFDRTHIGVPTPGQPCRSPVKHRVVNRVTRQATPASLETHAPRTLRAGRSLRSRRSDWTLRSRGSGVPFVALRTNRTGWPLRSGQARRPLVSLGYEHRPVLSFDRTHIGVPTPGQPCRSPVKHRVVNRVTRQATPASLETHAPRTLRAGRSLRSRRSDWTLRSRGSGVPFVALRTNRTGWPLRSGQARRPLVSLGYEHRPVLSFDRTHIGVPTPGQPCRSPVKHRVVNRVTRQATPASLETHAPRTLRAGRSLRSRRSDWTLRSRGSGVPFVALRTNRTGWPLRSGQARRPLVSLGYEHRPVLSFDRTHIGVPTPWPTMPIPRKAPRRQPRLVPP